MNALLLEALVYPSTKIDIYKKQEKLMTVLYGITISEEIMTKYFSSIDQKTQQPSVPLVLFVKHLRDNDITTFNNETTIHMDITHKITDQISPSILHYETIKEDIKKEDTTTPLGTTLINLLQSKDKVYNTIDTHFQKIQEEVLQPHDKSGIISERVIIMEVIDGTTVYDSKDQVPDTLQFDVFYLLIKLAKAGYSHGDPHTRNIMKVQLADGSNKLYLIDYERATSITNLKFQILSDRDLQTIEVKFPYIVELYEETLSKLNELVQLVHIQWATPDEFQDAINTVIVKYINSLLEDREYYIRAVLVIAMCRSDIYDSLLYWTTHMVVMPENVAGDKERFHSYDYLFDGLTIDLIDTYYTRIRELSIRELRIRELSIRELSKRKQELSIRELSKRKQEQDFVETPIKSIKQGGLRKYKTNNNSIRFKKKHRKKHTKKHRRKHTKKHRKNILKAKK